MKKHTTKIVSALAVLSLAVGCGNDSSSGGGDGSSSSVPQLQEEDAPLDGSNIQGHYQAKFVTLNPQVNGTIPGSANFFRKDDKLFAYVRLFAGGVKAWHMQHVYEGSRCPTVNDDTNGDGFIDIQEAEAVVGKILIPMDSDITTQSSGRRFFPLADLSGYYHYERITSFKRFLNDLMDADSDPADDVTKLAPGEGLRISGRVFMVLGVAETVDLPETVATKERRRSFQTLPIACGVFEKVDTIPGTTYVQDEIPGPVASVEPGQDRPADEPIPDGSTTGSTSGSGSGSGSNESDDGDGPTSDGGPAHSTGGTSGGSSTTGTTGGGHTTGGTTTGSTEDGSTTGTTDGGSTTGDSSSTDTGTTGTSTTTTTTTSSSSSSTSSSSTGGTTGGFLDSSSGI